MRSGSKTKKSHTRNRYAQQNSSNNNSANSSSLNTSPSSSTGSEQPLVTSTSAGKNASESLVATSSATFVSSSSSASGNGSSDKLQVNGSSKGMSSNNGNASSNGKEEKPGNNHGACKLPKKRKFDYAELEGMQNEDKPVNKILVVSSSQTPTENNVSSTGIVVRDVNSHDAAANTTYVTHTRSSNAGVEDLTIKPPSTASINFMQTARILTSNGSDVNIVAPVDMRSTAVHTTAYNRAPATYMQTQPLSLVSANKQMPVPLQSHSNGAHITRPRAVTAAPVDNQLPCRTVTLVQSGDTKTVHFINQPTVSQQQPHHLPEQEQISHLHQQPLLIKDSSVQVSLQQGVIPNKQVVITQSGANVIHTYVQKPLHSNIVSSNARTSSGNVVSAATAYHLPRQQSSNLVAPGDAQSAEGTDAGGAMYMPGHIIVAGRPATMQTAIRSDRSSHEGTPPLQQIKEETKNIQVQHLLQQSQPVQIQQQHVAQPSIARPIPMQAVQVQTNVLAQANARTQGQMIRFQQQTVQNPQQVISVSRGMVIASNVGLAGVNAAAADTTHQNNLINGASKRQYSGSGIHKQPSNDLVRSNSGLRNAMTGTPELAYNTTTSRPLVNLCEWEGHRILAKKSGHYYPAVISAVRTPCDLIVRLDHCSSKELLYNNVFSNCKYDVVSDSVPSLQQLVEGVRVVARSDKDQQIFVEGEILEKRHTGNSIHYLVRIVSPDGGPGQEIMLMRPHLRLLQPPWWEDLESASHIPSPLTPLTPRPHSSTAYPKQGLAITGQYTSDSHHSSDGIVNYVSTSSPHHSRSLAHHSSSSGSGVHMSNTVAPSASDMSIMSSARRQAEEYDSDDELRREDISFPSDSGIFLFFRIFLF